jgi:hypothetical protein
LPTKLPEKDRKRGKLASKDKLIWGNSKVNVISGQGGSGQAERPRYYLRRANKAKRE